MLAPSCKGNHSSHHRCLNLCQEPLKTKYTKFPLYATLSSREAAHDLLSSGWQNQNTMKYHKPVFTAEAKQNSLKTFKNRK